MNIKKLVGIVMLISMAISVMYPAAKPNLRDSESYQGNDYQPYGGMG